MSGLKILHVIGSADPKGGGPADGVLRSAQALVAAGHDCEILTLDSSGPAFALGDIICHPVGPAAHGSQLSRSRFIGKRYRFSLKISAWLTQNKSRFDLVIVNGVWNYSSVACLMELRRTGPPMLLFTHGMLSPWFAKRYFWKGLFKRLWWYAVERRVLEAAASVLYTSAEEQHLARMAYAPYRPRAEHIVGYSAADPNDRDPESSDSGIDASGRQAPPGPYFLFLGRLDHVKGCDLLLEAFACSKAARDGEYLAIVGPDPVGLRSKLEIDARRLRIDRQIWFLPMATGASKWSLLRNAQAFVLPSHSESFGVAVAEALACGVPVLISDKVGICREVRSDDAGLVFPDTTEGMLGALQAFSSLDVAARQSMGRRARECFEAHFSAATASKRLVDVIESTLDESHMRETRGG